MDASALKFNHLKSIILVPNYYYLVCADCEENRVKVTRMVNDLSVKESKRLTSFVHMFDIRHHKGIRRERIRLPSICHTKIKIINRKHEYFFDTNTQITDKLSIQKSLKLKI